MLVAEEKVWINILGAWHMCTYVEGGGAWDVMSKGVEMKKRQA